MLEEKLGRIAELRKQLQPLEEQAKPIKEELDHLKFEVMEEMKARRSKRTEAVAGVYAIRAERKTFRVEDESSVRAWMEDNGYKADDYTTLDAKKVGTLAKSTLVETGEIMPGVAEAVTEYVTLKEAA